MCSKVAGFTITCRFDAIVCLRKVFNRDFGENFVSLCAQLFEAILCVNFAFGRGYASVKKVNGYSNQAQFSGEFMRESGEFMIIPTYAHVLMARLKGLKLLLVCLYLLLCRLYDLTEEDHIGHPVMLIAHDHIGNRNLFAYDHLRRSPIDDDTGDGQQGGP